MQTACLVTAVIAAAAYLAVHLTQSVKYLEFVEPLDKDEYFFKRFLGASLYLVDKFGIMGSGRYFSWLHQKVVMLYGSRYSSFYLKIHWASKVLYLFLGVFLAGIIGFLGEATGWEWIVFLPGMGILLFFLADKTLDDRYKKKKLAIQRDFPDFISNVVLLVNAGLGTRQAIERIAQERGGGSPLYRELQTALNDIRAGMSEQEAYSDFTERCKTKEITNFISIMLQNMKIGGGQMLYELKRMGVECWDMRKNVAKQLGETASSKLMLPLVIMFIAIILICMMPAVMELGSAF